MTRFAGAHPGKMGDALYTLPTMRYVWEQTGGTFDFYTSEYCEPLRDLFLYQPYIDNFIVPDNYTVERMDMGCQPWYIPIHPVYERIYQMGFQRIPDRAIHQFIAHEQGIDVPLAVQYDYPATDRPCIEPYICIAPRSRTTFFPLFDRVCALLKDQGMNVALIGGSGDDILSTLDLSMNFLGYSMLDTVSIMSHADGFLGLMSSQLVLANGFPYPKVAPHDGKSWDMGHVIKQASNHYPINPTADQVLALLKG